MNIPGEKGIDIPAQAKVKRKGGELIAEFLVKEKIPYVFGICGRICGHGNVGLLDPLHEVRDKVQLIAPRHEQTAAHMADGYFRVRHKPVATLTSTGPGSANLIMALAALLREIEEVRRKGIAYDDGEFDGEVRCVAVPVFDFSGRVAGALGISGPVWRLSLQALQGYSQQVREAARLLSMQFGFNETKPVRAA